MENKITINFPIIVEGRYDKIKLDSIINGLVVATNGFSIFTDPPLKNMILQLSKKDKIILLLDSDSAGFKIRGFLHSMLPGDCIIDLYIPDILGKEKRKTAASKEGKLGVEGVPADVLRSLFSDLVSESAPHPVEEITKQDFIRLGLSGGKDSSVFRKELYKKLELPELISTKNAIIMLNRMITKKEFNQLVEDLRR